ncbi:hypothetical protein QBC35DRAFT_62968 [Podospora australis]|uniref:Lpxtg-domain-containing protein n=1 Tax=Podospora australis TaxID=1536484 RepID=A0AAN7ALP3_9PEZI|nr:hypothetical protein QBC35DRAFT_62968 [Podospora australis]
MWTSTVARISVAVVVSAPLAAGLFNTPNSPCSRYCGNVQDRTASDEIVCDKSAFGTPAGLVWEQCIRCQLTSTHSYANRTDLGALIYNLRYNMDHCLWHAGSSPCITTMACGPLEDAVKYRKNVTVGMGTYDFCSAWEDTFVPRCSGCLTQLTDSGHYLNNYLMILEAACEQKPSPGETISVKGDPFGSEPIVIIPPEPTYATIPAPDYGAVSLGARVGIALGGLAFLLVIVGFCIVCNGKRRRRAFLRDLERRHGKGQWPHPATRYGPNGPSISGGNDMLETPASVKPLRGWENESPVSAGGTLPRYFSPYTSTYNSPVTGPGGSATVAPNWPTLSPQQMHTQRLEQLIQEQSPAHGSPPPAFFQWPSPGQNSLLMQMQAEHNRKQTEIAIGLALGGDEASLRSKPSNGKMNSNSGDRDRYGYPVESKGKEREAHEVYELKEVPSPNNGQGDVFANGSYHNYQMPTEPQAPVLHHPGYGRAHTGGRPGSGGNGGQMMGLGLQTVSVS